MKTILLLSFLLISKITFAGVSCGTHDRGMYVDCMVDIINEQNNGNSGPWLKLINYAHHNCMSYVALFGLDQGVMGNATLENVLSDMVVVFHNAGIKVGAVGSASTFLMTTSEACHIGLIQSTTVNIPSISVRMKLMCSKVSPMLILRAVSV